jgi:hypothetical protein
LSNRQGVRDLGPNPALATYVGAALLGGVVGAAITGKSEGTFVGVGLGLLVAALMNARGQGELEPG